MKSLIYLAGAMSCYEDEDDYFEKSVKWREEIQTYILAAADRLDIAAKFSFFDPTLTNCYSINHNIVHQNDYYLNKADILVVNCENLHKSIGTIYEIIVFALLGKPIVCFGYDKAVNHPHIKNMITCQLSTINEVADYIVTFYRQ